MKLILATLAFLGLVKADRKADHVAGDDESPVFCDWCDRIIPAEQFLRGHGLCSRCWDRAVIARVQEGNPRW